MTKTKQFDVNNIQPGMLCVMTWEDAWMKRGMRNDAGQKVAIKHTRWFIAKIDKVEGNYAEYSILALIGEIGRPPAPTPVRDVTGGGFSIAHAKESPMKLRAPAREELAMIPRSKRNIGPSLRPEYKVPKAYAARGMEIFHTGGGCTGLWLEFTSGCYALVTEEDEANAPRSDEEPVSVGIYEPEGEGEPLAYRDCRDAKEALQFIEEAEERYSPAHQPEPKQLAQTALMHAVKYIRRRLNLDPSHEFPHFDGDETDRIIAILTRYGQQGIHGLMKEREKLPEALPTARALARMFSAEIVANLSETDLEAVRHRNSSDPDAWNGKVCHTHDFIDANDCMLHAWVKLTRTDSSPDSEQHADLMDEAWALAKKAEFNTSAFRDQ